VIDEVFADHYLDVVKAAALLRLPPTLTEGLARIPTEGPLARSSADERVKADEESIGSLDSGAGSPNGTVAVSVVGIDASRHRYGRYWKSCPGSRSWEPPPRWCGRPGSGVSLL
jgi:hypothetical protein